MAKKVVKTEQLTLHDIAPFSLPVVIEYKSIRHVYMQIKENKKGLFALVRSPLTIKQADIVRMLYHRRKWLEEKIEHYLQKKGEQKYHWFVGQAAREDACWIDLFGKRYYLQWKTYVGKKKPFVHLHEEKMDVYVPAVKHVEKRQAILEAWLKSVLYTVITEYIARWTPQMGVTVDEVRIRKMRTRWGTCIPTRRRLWFSLMLVHEPFEAIEYVVVHELAHLLEASHSRRFWQIVESYIPEWQRIRRMLRSRSSSLT
ncbi:MAG: SprT family zinc-dependent metalloprotease [Candidatus Carbobacillus sp.]|nr:SprT family zinc-dependent metalloprotease [Candidatus Carbobacillus sp.]